MLTDVAPRYDRRSFMSYFSSIGLASTLLPGVLWARVHAGAEITPASIASAEEIAGLTFTDAKPAALRNLVMTRVDPVLYGWSYDFVGDTAETISLIWPPRPGLSSTLWISVPSGMFLNGSALPGRMSTFGPATIVSPVFSPFGCRM